jgi:hypothetical protein
MTMILFKIKSIRRPQTEEYGCPFVTMANYGEFNHRILARVYRGGSYRERRYPPVGRNEESAVNCVLDPGNNEFA